MECSIFSYSVGLLLYHTRYIITVSNDNILSNKFKKKSQTGTADNANLSFKMHMCDKE